MKRLFVATLAALVALGVFGASPAVGGTASSGGATISAPNYPARSGCHTYAVAWQLFLGGYVQQSYSITITKSSKTVAATGWVYLNADSGTWSAPICNALGTYLVLMSYQASSNNMGTIGSVATTMSIVNTPIVTISSPAGPITVTNHLKPAWSVATAYTGIRHVQTQWTRVRDGGGVVSAPTTTTLAATARTMTLIGSTGYRYCFRARASTAAGVYGAWSTQLCTAIPIDDRDLVASAGWTRGFASGWLAGTSTTASTADRALATRVSERVRRVGVVGLGCPACGSIAVYVGSTKVGTISLVRATNARVTRLLPSFATARTGVVRLVTLTAGKTTSLDGLVLSAW